MSNKEYKETGNPEIIDIFKTRNRKYLIVFNIKIESTLIRSFKRKKVILPTHS